MSFFGCKKKEIEPKWKLARITEKVNDATLTLFEFTWSKNLEGFFFYPEIIGVDPLIRGRFMTTLNYQNNKLHSAEGRNLRNNFGVLKISYTYNENGLLTESKSDNVSNEGNITESRDAYFDYHISRNLKSKSFNSYLLSYEYDLTGNLTKAKLDYDVESKIYEISFDDNDNPFYGIPLEYVFEATGLWGFMSLSKKQITSIKYTEYYNGDIRSSYTIHFNYTYDELGRPTTLKQTFGKNVNSTKEFSYYYQ